MASQQSIPVEPHLANNVTHNDMIFYHLAKQQESDDYI